MIHHIEVTQETMVNIDPNDMIIPTDKIKVINETAHDQLIASRERRITKPESIPQ